ncbi:MAG TPA: hypothetical protein VFZ56_02750 [Gemmatimonadaceae bacterium]
MREPAATVSNGAALAAFMAAAVGAFTLGVVVILNEAGLLTMPAAYAPAGGVSGRTTAAVVTWLLSWVVLHRRWSGREIEGRRIRALTYALITLGVVLNLPPVWKLL